MKSYKKKQCPNCGSEKVILITYGYIDDLPQIIQQIEDGEIETGGCCVDDNSPKWKCRECEESFGKVNWA